MYYLTIIKEMFRLNNKDNRIVPSRANSKLANTCSKWTIKILKQRVRCAKSQQYPHGDTVIQEAPVPLSITLNKFYSVLLSVLLTLKTFWSTRWCYSHNFTIFIVNSDYGLLSEPSLALVVIFGTPILI